MAAKAIVTRLWTRREAALSALSPAAVARVETAVAATEDRAYVGDVRCGCAQAKAGHTIMSILPEIPRTAPEGAFFAQVRTTNTTTGAPVWYVIAVVRRAGTWRIAYVNFGGYKARPPLTGLGVAAGATAAVTARDRARMVHIARREAAWAGAHGKHVDHTSYGATIRARAGLRLGGDGVFGLTLPGGKVFACYTLHELDTYTLPGGLAQDESREQWGRQLAPGGYRSIVVDTDQPYCVAGSGRGAAVPPAWLEYSPQQVAVTGTRL
ncbi:MAG TPA: hypothetical protein VN615_01690 [Gaiellales bacterium]|nr:hypothetical protein [Gaiellales bacterium]